MRQPRRKERTRVMTNIDEMLKELTRLKGSDLHLAAGMPPAIRKNGQLGPMEGCGRLSPEQVKGMIMEILTTDQAQRFEHDPRARYELDFAYSISGVGRFRFNVHKQRGTMGAVIRALATTIPELASLGLPDSAFRLTEARKGMALVTGPTGSGKSTTLAAIIDAINVTRDEHILTIEDPIEYLHRSKKSFVRQREVGEDGDTLSFQNALKHALRQDPDVILIGEMRDYETIGIAITSAETGHLVFGTLHTQSASQTIGRIVDVFPGDQVEQVRTQLSATLFSVLAQVLLPRKDGTGRICACEIMFANHAIRNNIRANNHDAIYQSIQTGQREGMQTMDQSLVALVKSGTVAFDVARRYLRDEISLRQLAGHAAEAMPNAAETPATTTTGAVSSAETTAQPRRGLGAMIRPPWEKG
jgi:twitching motility protein PilT